MQTINTSTRNSCNLARHQARIRHVFTEPQIAAEYKSYVAHRRHDRRLLIVSTDECVHERHHFGHLKEFPHACRKPMQPTQPGQKSFCSVPRNPFCSNTRCIAFSTEDRVTMSLDNRPSAREGASDPMSGGATLDRAYRPHQLPCCPCKDDDPLQGEYMGERQAKLDPSGINPATNALPPLSAWSLGPTTCGSSTLPTQIRFSQHIL